MKLDCQTLDADLGGPDAEGSVHSPESHGCGNVAVALLTGGSDKPYVFGITSELLSKGIKIDLIGSDELDDPAFRNRAGLNFLNLRGDQQPGADLFSKTVRILKYYYRLLRYAAIAKPKIFHILWNNKFEMLDRTLLMLYYRILGKSIVLTAHNVNGRKRDANDSLLNRLTLRTQYHLSDHIFVHTDRMKAELIKDFGTKENRVTVIPFGINNAVPNTQLGCDEAKRRLGLSAGDRTLLFFGRITPYKGLECLLDALRQISANRHNYRLIVAGRPDCSEEYWAKLREELQGYAQRGSVMLRLEFIPDDQVEVYFKAADALVLPYKEIYQSGVLFLAHSFGLPVLAADVGSLKDDIVEGKTGSVFKPEDPADLAAAIESYFGSDLFLHLTAKRQDIVNYAVQRHSWDLVGRTTISRYLDVL